LEVTVTANEALFVREPGGRPSARILLLQDDLSLGRQICASLYEVGHETTWLRDAHAAAESRPLPGYGLLILDLMLPGTSGLDFLRRYRGVSDVPILAISARRDANHKVRALRLGADDCVTKPFWVQELVARAQALLRRPRLKRDETLETGGLTVDLEARRARVAGAAVDLTRVEFDLLVALIRRAGTAVTRRWLVDHVLDAERRGGERTLDVHLLRLRRKLGEEGRRIATVYGQGYRLEGP
jgi:DNA-binding response OmpR family regulator